MNPHQEAEWDGMFEAFLIFVIGLILYLIS
jgi:hypothetical protein